MTSDQVHVPRQTAQSPTVVSRGGVVAGALMVVMSLVLGGFHTKAFAQTAIPSTGADEAGSSQSAPKKPPPAAAKTQAGPEAKARQTTTTTEPTRTTAGASSSTSPPKKAPPPAAKTQAGQTTTTTEPTRTTAGASSSRSEPRAWSTAAPTSSPATTADDSPGNLVRAAATPARLATAGNFAILAGTPNITNTGPTTITGDVGLHPGNAVTGFAPCVGSPPAPADCVILTGATHLGDAVAETAKTDLVTAYNNLVGLESTCTPVDVELAGRTYGPGVYCSPGTFGLSGGILTLDAGGNPDAEFIFLTGAGGSTLITDGGQVLLIGGAQACNVYWQVASSATIGVGTAFVGNILALTSIQLQTAATLQGRALARNGAVTLDTNTITRADCAAVVPPGDGGGGVTPPGDGGGGVTPPGDGGGGVTPPGDGGGGVTSPTTGDTTGRATLTLTGANLRSTDGTLSTLSSSRSARDSGAAGQAGRAGQKFAVTGAAIQWQLFLAAMAIVLGGLMVLLSQPRRGASRRRSVAGA